MRSTRRPSAGPRPNANAIPGQELPACAALAWRPPRATICGCASAPKSCAFCRRSRPARRCSKGAHQTLQGVAQARNPIRQFWPRRRASTTCSIDGVCAGDMLEIRLLLFGNAGHFQSAFNYPGKICYRVEPNADNWDQFGSTAAAGSAKNTSAAPTPTPTAARRGSMARAHRALTPRAWPRLRSATRHPSRALINAHRHLADVDIPAALPKRGTEIALAARRVRAPGIARGRKAPSRSRWKPPDL